MLIIRRTLGALTNNCKRGWRYDEGSCFFNTKCALSLMLAINFFTVLTLIMGRQKVVSSVYSISKSFPYLLIIVPVIFFLILTLFYSKEHVLQIEATQKQEKRIFFIFILYSILSVALLLIASLKK